MQATIGDRICIHGSIVGHPDKNGEIVEVHGDEGTPPYLVKFDDGKKEERVTFGKVDNDVFVSRPGEPGAAKADATDFNDVNKSLDEISK